MTDIDKQRIAAVQLLEALGFKWDGTYWAPTDVGDYGWMIAEDPNRGRAQIIQQGAATEPSSPLRWYREAHGADFDGAPPCPRTSNGKHSLALTGTWCVECGLRGMVPGGKG